MKVNQKVLFMAGGVVIWALIPFSTELMTGSYAVLRAWRLRRLRRLQRAVAEMAREAQPSITKMGTFRHYNMGRSAWIH